MGKAFPNATYRVCAQTRISNGNLPSSCSAATFDRTHRVFFCQKRERKKEALHEELGLHIEMQPIQTPVSVSGEGFYYTSQSLSTVLEFSLGMSTAARFCFFLCPFFASLCVCHCKSLSSRYLYSKVKPSFFLWPHFS